MGYVHWTFPDQTVEDQYPSYLMARRVRPLGDGVLKTTADDALSKLKGVVEAASAVCTHHIRTHRRQFDNGLLR